MDPELSLKAADGRTMPSPAAVTDQPTQIQNQEKSHNDASSSKERDSVNSEPKYLSGLGLFLVAIGLCFAVFLVALVCHLNLTDDSVTWGVNN
jgi:hypothetical protein